MLKSFSYEIKKELSQLNNLAKKNEVKYELLGYLASGNIEKTKTKIKFSTENEYNINRFGKLLKNVNINDFKIDLQGKVYVITAVSTEYFKQSAKYISMEIFNKADEQEKRAFVRGIFMGSGSVNNPENKYHLEIKIEDSELVNELIQILQKYDINIKSIDKAIYIKDGEEISKFLAFIGANKSVLEFEQIRVQREMNNKINRLVNCKTANLNKILNASVDQINAIKRLKENGKFSKLDKGLQELAELRLEYPDMPLAELGTKLKNPIGKSGVNYRLKKIIQLSK